MDGQFVLTTTWIGETPDSRMEAINLAGVIQETCKSEVLYKPRGETDVYAGLKTTCRAGSQAQFSISVSCWF